MADKKMYKVGLTVKEPWSPDISYEVLDITLYAVENGGDGCSYTAIKPNQGVTPGTDDTVWVKSTQAGQSIYDLAVKYHHFVGTEEEFEQQYQDALAAANNAAAAASATDEEIKANELSRVSAENGRVAAEQSRVSAEQSRVSAESARVSAESARVSAESSRESAEATRASNESARVTAENSRVSAESARVTAEQSRLQQFEALKTDMNTAIANVDAKAAEIEEDIEGYEANEAARVTAEDSRVSAESSRVSAESARVTAETARVAQASSDHTRAETDHGTAASDHTTAQADHTQASSDHTQATSDHTTASADHTQAGADHTASETATQAANAAAEAADTARKAIQDDLDAKANIADLLSGDLIPAQAEELSSWAAREDSPVDSVSYDLIRTTGGDESIKSSGGAVLLSMACVGEDFTPVCIISSGRNLLRLQSNNGLAVAVGSGFYFPVPHLVATNDSIGTANQNNGVLFTDKDGNNLTPTVYFKPLADGAPTSVTDGTAATYLDKNGHRHYTTSGPGFLIVSGITWAETCAHLGWSTGYDVFTSPTDVNDAGTIVSTTNIGTLRSVGSGALMVSDTAVRLSDTQMTKTVNVGVSSALAWTDVADTDSEGATTGTYTHTATVSAMLYGGVAEIKLNGGSAFVGLDVNGTVVSFSDGNATVESGYEVKYQLATPTTSTVNVTTLFPNINDWGIEYVEATGEGHGLWQYTQGIDDAIYALLAKRKQDNEVIAEAFAFLSRKIDALVSRVKTYEAKLKVAEIDTKTYKVMNRPTVLRNSVAGAPSADNVPSNWDASLYGAWQGGAISFEQSYVDTASGKWYRPISVTNTPADWVPMN